jgi:hypothetical protein
MQLSYQKGTCQKMTQKPKKRLVLASKETISMHISDSLQRCMAPQILNNILLKKVNQKENLLQL